MHLDDLDTSEKEALHAYKAARTTEDGHSLCFDVNASLESGLWTDELPAAMQGFVRSLDGVLARTPPLVQTMTVYRCTPFVAPLGRPEQGRLFRSLSYWSTSTSKESCLKFLGTQFEQSRGAIIELRLIPGLRVYDMETLVGSGGSEREILLPRGILWKIKGWKPGELDQVPGHLRSRYASVSNITLEAVAPLPRPLA
ncbi:hypothetical protein CLBKND_01592 [Methylorubrum aminovorans]